MATKKLDRVTEKMINDMITRQVDHHLARLINSLQGMINRGNC